MSPVRIALLGSTGSIGVNALKVASSLKGMVRIVALSTGSNIKLLADQAALIKPKVVCLSDCLLAAKMKRSVPAGTEVICGVQGLEEIVSRPDVDMVVFAISGSACLKPLITALKHKKRIALANKEALVSAGHIVMRLAEENSTPIIPIDSEHSAIFQCLEGKRAYLKRIYLTASGGPLLNIPSTRFDSLSPDYILDHPKWKMGKKISVDSATMMNKGLEIIEAKWLFGIDDEDISVLIHPEAVIHSMVELIDGAVFAQLSVPDMRLPIQYAITYPGRLKSMIKELDFSKIRDLSFDEPDLKKFPCLALARAALKKGSVYPAILNAADETAVRQFLGGRIVFSRISSVIEKVLGRYTGSRPKEPSLNDILNAEEWAREEAVRLCH